MKEQVYKQALGKIKASDEFKERLIENMQREKDKENIVEINNKKKKILYALSAAAVICIILTAGWAVWASNKQSETAKVNKPGTENTDYKNVITFKDNESVTDDNSKLSVMTGWGGAGCEGFTAHDAKEVYSGNPWNKDSNIKTLPVFKNNIYVEPEEQKCYGKTLTKEQLLKIAKETVTKLNVNGKKVYTTPTKEELESYKKEKDLPPEKREYFEKQEKELSGKATGAKAEFDGGAVIVYGDGDIDIEFYCSLKIPDKYSFTFRKTNRKQAEEVLDYLLKKYKDVINMKSPKKSLFCDIDNEGNERFDYTAYEDCGSLTDRMLSYSCNTVQFFPDDNGKLSTIKIRKSDLSQKTGVYPIISTEEAERLLLDGHFQSSYIDVKISKKNISHVQLVYENSIYVKEIAPYYKFFIEGKNIDNKNGEKNFYVCYVPAVEGKYISNMPKYNDE